MRRSDSGVNVLAESQRAISEYYARPVRTHDRAGEEAGAALSAPSMERPFCVEHLAYLECQAA